MEGTNDVPRPKVKGGFALRCLLDVLTTAHDLRRFKNKQWITRFEWDGIRPERQAELRRHGYVMIGHERVYLTLLGLQVLTYRESTG